VCGGMPTGGGEPYTMPKLCGSRAGQSRHPASRGASNIKEMTKYRGMLEPA
jgi:hypothetical protein